MSIRLFKIVGVFALAAIIFIAPFVSTKAHVKATDKLWVQTAPGVWEELEDQQYECDGTPNICAMRFPVGTNPYDNPNDGILESADGFAVIQP